MLFLQFFQDVNNESDFLQYCSFLPDVNNLNSVNQTYKNNMLALDAFVMIGWPNSTLFSPSDSEWFGFNAPLQNTTIYQNDLLGLKVSVCAHHCLRK